MSLATQCPHCKTTFRVAQDQLKLRAGLVRCGACREIFNGVEHLLTPEEAPQPQTRPADARTMAGAAEQAALQSNGTELDFAYPDFEFAANPVPDTTPPAPTDDAESDAIEAVDFVETPKSKMAASIAAALEPLPAALTPGETFTIEAFPAEPFLAEIEQLEAELAVPADAPPDADANTEDRADAEDGDPAPAKVAARGKKKKRPAPARQAEAIPDLSETGASEEPDFVKRGRRRQRFGRALRFATVAGVAFLLLGVLGQCVYAFREQIAARLPQAKPGLLAACTLLRCQIGLPMQIENISIESHELETLGANKDSSELTLSLRNMSSTAQAWPHIELTLNDGNGALLARRVFAPNEYLGNAHDAAAGLAADSEQSVTLYIGFHDAKPAGYRVGVFYP